MVIFSGIKEEKRRRPPPPPSFSWRTCNSVAWLVGPRRQICRGSRGKREAFTDVFWGAILWDCRLIPQFGRE